MPFSPLPEDSQLLVIDVQQAFLNAIPIIAETATVGRRLIQLTTGCASLGLPITITQQVPTKLGPTLPGLLEVATGATTHDKSAFSVMADEALHRHLADTDRGTIIVAGIEAHICVLGSVADLLCHGYQVIVAADAVASRTPDHATMACTAMTQLGAVMVPVEAILFRLLGDATDPRFKTISSLIR